MLNFFQRKTDDIVIECPMCFSNKTIKKKEVDNLKERKIISFGCTCGSRFYKQISRKNFKEIDLISAIANADFEVLWYKIKLLLFFLDGMNKSEKIKLVSIDSRNRILHSFFLRTQTP
jgi:hypothetical protein